MSEIKSECRDLAGNIAIAIVNSERVLDGLRKDDKAAAMQFIQYLKNNVEKLGPWLDLKDYRAMEDASEAIKEMYIDPALIDFVEAKVRLIQSTLLSNGFVQVAACQCE